MRAILASLAFCVTASKIEPEVSYTDRPNNDKKPPPIESPQFHPPPSKRSDPYLFLPPPPLPSPPLPSPRALSPPWPLTSLASPAILSPLSPLPAPSPPSSQFPLHSSPFPAAPQLLANPPPTSLCPPVSSPAASASSSSPSSDAVASPARQANSNQDIVISSHPLLNDWVVYLFAALLCLVALIVCVNTLIAVKSILLTCHLRDMLRRSAEKQIQMSEPAIRPVVHDSFC